LLSADYFKKTFRFLPNSSIPLYFQLETYIKMQIKASVLKSGDRMITETELCDILKVSRTTVRQSMKHLVDDGLLVRYRRKGSFIADEKMRRTINYLYNFTENIRDAGAVPLSIVLKQEIRQADQFIREKLKLPLNNNKVFFLFRLRCADGVPILLEHTYIPYYLCEGIEAFDFSERSLYQTLSGSYALNLFHAEETIEAVIIKGKNKDILKCKTVTPGYKIERVSYLDSEYVFEYTTSLTRSDKCIFRLDLYNNAKAARKSVDFERQLQIN
jgi:GntR family transcriptional regulator